MNVLAINGSPRGAQGNTEILVRAFLGGARESGAKTETIYIADMEIRPCAGCFSCWTQTPGVCIHDDDMPNLLVRIREADTVVLASPLYGGMVTGLMKNCLDRMLPLSHPAIQKIGDQYVHPARYEKGVFRLVVISNAGFPETHHFDGLKATFSQYDRGPRSALGGMICCAAGPMLSVPSLKDAVAWYLDATIQAGREVVREGRISEETQAILDRSLADDPGAYASTVNTYWESFGVEIPSSEGGSASDAVHDGTPLDPAGSSGSVRALVSKLPGSFSQEAAGDLRAAIQFDIADEDPGRYFVTIEDGRCAAFEGDHPTPSVTIHAPAQIWLDICSGALDGAAAFMSGQYRVTGDVSLLMRFSSLFSGGGTPQE